MPEFRKARVHPPPRPLSLEKVFQKCPKTGIDLVIEYTSGASPGESIINDWM
jgi:hypothetical protein